MALRVTPGGALCETGGRMASWQIWALASAGFAALTAVLAKLGVAHVSPDVATFIRTVVVLAVC